MTHAVIFGVAGPALEDAERDFFRDVDPLGFILFQRNCQNRAQLAALCAALREAVGRATAPILIDQEGGRVARLAPPEWRARTAMAPIGALWGRDADAGERAAWLAARLIAHDLREIGVTVDCAPVLDVPQADSDAIIGDRAFAAEPEPVAALGRAFMAGLHEGGVVSVVKHIPGHGRATVDSHKALPRTPAPLDDLAAVDFAPFRALNDAPMAMTAHVVYEALDSAAPATISPRVIAEIIRGRIGFDGLLMSDDLSMAALDGSFVVRARAALDAGCDVALHCNGRMEEMRAAAQGARPMTERALMRAARAMRIADHIEPFDAAAGEAELAALLGAAAQAAIESGSITPGPEQTLKG